MAERGKEAKIVLVGVLGITLAIVLIRQYGGTLFASDKPSAPSTFAALPKSGQFHSNPDRTNPTATRVQWERPHLVGLLSRDPMQVELPEDEIHPEEQADHGSTSTESTEPAPEFRVAGIVFNADQPSSVIIDGSILHEGEKIHGATVTRITKEHAVLTRGDKTWIVKPGQSNREPE